jgi:hypothetical protein
MLCALFPSVMVPDDVTDKMRIKKAKSEEAKD